MGRLSEKQLLIITIASGALLVILCGFLIYWFNSERGAVVAEIAVLQTQVDERNRMQQENADLERDFGLDSRKDEEANFDRQLPLENKEAGDTEFVAALNKLRGGLPILIRKVEAVSERAGTGGFAPPKDVRKMVYRVELRGRFFDILEYLSAVENDDRIIRVEHFLFKKKQSTGGDQESKETLVDATVRVLGFEYQAPVAAPAAAAAPAPGAPPAR